MTALLLLGPATPMLFQGQEFALVDAVSVLRRSRRRALARWSRRAGASSSRSSRAWPTRTCRPALADSGDRQTFERCKLDLGERTRHAEAYALHRDLLRCGATTRRSRAPTAAARRRGARPRRVRAALLRARTSGDRLLLVNLGATWISRRLASRCSRRRSARPGGWSGPASVRPTAAQGTPAVDVERGWTIPRTVRVVACARAEGRAAVDR